MERFWHKVCKTENCWVWTGAPNTHGYGEIKMGRKKYLAHRLSYMLEYGEIPKNKLICHKCDNKLCVRPDHLYAGSPRENMLDRCQPNRMKPEK